MMIMFVRYIYLLFCERCGNGYIFCGEHLYNLFTHKICRPIYRPLRSSGLINLFGQEKLNDVKLTHESRQR